MPPTRSERLILAGLVAFFTAVYVLYGVFRHWSFHTSYDLAIFDQAVWHLARFEQPASSIKGMANLFGDHFHPAIALFVPAYWVSPGPVTLIVVQGVLLAAAIVPIYFFLRRRLPAGPAFALCASYGFFWGIQHAAAFDVHEYAFAPLVIACAILAMDRRHWPAFWIAIAALMLVKEDLIPLAACFGVPLIAMGERRRGVALIAAGTLAFLFVLGSLIPWINGAPSSYIGQYAELLRAPWRIPMALVTPPEKAMAVLLWVAPFVFLPLASPLAVLLIPLALVRLLSPQTAYWGIAFHHATPLAPILAVSAGDGLSRLARRLHAPAARRRVLAWTAGISVLFSAILPGNQPFWDLFEQEHYRRHPDAEIWSEMAARIPSDASVVAQGALLPHLTRRQHVYLLEERALDGGTAEFIATTSSLGLWPAPDHETREAWIDERRRAGYRTVFERDGWLLLQRPRE